MWPWLIVNMLYMIFPVVFITWMFVENEDMKMVRVIPNKNKT